MSRPKVFLVDDHELFRKGVRAELGDAVDMVGEASEVDAAVEMILERRPDVVLLDVHMPAGGGRAVVQRVRQRRRRVDPFDAVGAEVESAEERRGDAERVDGGADVVEEAGEG